MGWLRGEYEGREDELETRAEFEKRTGVTAQSLSSHFSRYADKVPKVAKKFGKQKWFVAAELDGFIGWIAENSGTRSDADIMRAEIARLDSSIEDVEDRLTKHREALAIAEADMKRLKRKRSNAVSDLRFLEQGED